MLWLLLSCEAWVIQRVCGGTSLLWSGGGWRRPPILILDEATSGLDSEVENLIHDAVRRLMKGRTSFLIAHRLASAVDADVIVVLDRGKIVEVGAHAELVKRAGVYSQLFNEQT